MAKPQVSVDARKREDIQCIYHMGRWHVRRRQPRQQPQQASQPLGLSQPQSQPSQAALPPAPQPAASAAAPLRRAPLQLSLAEWIPHKDISDAFAAKGVRKLYPWQAGALECGVAGNNLVYCAPTSGEHQHSLCV